MATLPKPKPPRWDFTAQTAVISAGARGIGSEIVRSLAEAGANVVFGDIDRASGRNLETLLQKAKGQVRFVEADFAMTNAWEKLRKRCEKEGWQATIGVANAGIARECPVESITPKEYARIEAINQRSSLWMAKTLTPALRENSGGAFIFIGSVMSEFGFPNYSLYGMTKNAVVGLTRSLAIELAPAGIRVNCVQPGYTLTDLPAELRSIVPAELQDRCRAYFDEQLQAHFAKLQPLPTTVTSHDVAQTVCFLASAAGRNITGSVLKVDGGLAVRFPSIATEIFPPDFLHEVRNWVQKQARTGRRAQKAIPQ